MATESNIYQNFIKGQVKPRPTITKSKYSNKYVQILLI